MSTMKFVPLLFLVVALFGAGDCRIGDSCTPGLNDDCYYKKPYGELYCNFKHEKCERRTYLLDFQTFAYRIGANTTALLIITASRVNSNTKAPKLLNLNNTTAS